MPEQVDPSSPTMKVRLLYSYFFMDEDDAYFVPAGMTGVVTGIATPAEQGTLKVDAQTPEAP